MQTCSEKEREALFSMPSSSEGQNKCIKEMLKNGELTLNQCYILKQNDQIMARVIHMDQIQHLAFLTIEELTCEEVKQFLIDVIHDLPPVEYCIALYEDKVHHDVIAQAISELPDVTILKKESYVQQTKDVREEKEGEYLNFGAMSKEMILSLYRQSCVQSKDGMTVRGIEQTGIKQAAEQFYQGLQSVMEHDDFYQCLLVNHQPVAFVAMNRLLDNEGGIFDIGVASQMRGHHYSEQLLKHMATIARQHQIDTLVGDIDADNPYIRNAVLQSGYQLYCRLTIFYIRGAS